MKFLERWTAVTLLGVVSFITSEAEAVTIGKLSYNGSGDVVTDTLNNREWLRWDVFPDLNYSQTVAEISLGGAYEGFKIAGIDEAFEFIDALLFGQSNDCSSSQTDFSRCSTSLSGADFISLMGSIPSSLIGSNEAGAFFLSNNEAGEEVGLLRAIRGNFFDADKEWGSISSSDGYSSSGHNAALPVPWIVYQDLAPVPTPGTLPMLLTVGGTFAFFALRRRRNIG